ncbi:MAG: response regulator [Pleurocapsa sp. SU_196_0]|nr:response regulator [Pleurocapsa sp. SU_196_0]
MNTVLIVDDHEDIRWLVRLTLEALNLEFLEAGTGSQALELARAHVPQLIFLDVMMPGTLDGLEVCRIIKADAVLQRSRVVLLTARGQQSDLEAGTRAGADGYLVKPFSPAALLSLAQSVLSDSKTS